jgi:hypothetical protein
MQNHREYAEKINACLQSCEPFSAEWHTYNAALILLNALVNILGAD